MAVRMMLASALALGLGAAALLAQPEPPAERVATRAEMLAAQAPRLIVVAAPASCDPLAMPARPAPTDI